MRLSTPESLAAVLKEHAPEIVEVGAFTVEEVAEQAVPDHVNDHKVGLTVAAVFEHEAVLACRLGGVYEFPAVLDGCGCGDLDEGVLATLHGGDRLRDVP